MAHFLNSNVLRNYHMVALLQTLPQYMEQSAAPTKPGPLDPHQSVFAAPSETESRYIGMALQAQFGVHLLGYHPPTLQVRAKELLTHRFFHSSTLIQFLARSDKADKSQGC